MSWPLQPPAAKESRLPSPQAASLVYPVGPLSPRNRLTLVLGSPLISPTPLFALFSGFLPIRVPHSLLHILTHTPLIPLWAPPSGFPSSLLV